MVPFILQQPHLFIPSPGKIYTCLMYRWEWGVTLSAGGGAFFYTCSGGCAPVILHPGSGCSLLCIPCCASHAAHAKVDLLLHWKYVRMCLCVWVYVRVVMWWEPKNQSGHTNLKSPGQSDCSTHAFCSSHCLNFLHLSPWADFPPLLSPCNL